MILGSRSLTLDAAGTEEIHTEVELFVGTFDFRVPTTFSGRLAQINDQLRMPGKCLEAFTS